MAELTMTNPGHEETERLTERLWLLALGTFHRKVCVGLDLGGELEILGEELARMRAVGEPMEEVHSFLAKHGIHVPVLVVQPQATTVTGPLAASGGTLSVMLVSLQLPEPPASSPLKKTLSITCAAFWMAIAVRSSIGICGNR